MDIEGYKLCTLYSLHRPICMGSVATFMIALIMKLMPQIKLCVIYKYGNIGP